MVSLNGFGGPVLKVDSAELQFGKFSANEAKQGEYTLRNIGDEALTISSVRSTCSCAKAEYPQVIAPGKSAKIKLSIGANSYNNKFQGKLYLITNLEEKTVELSFGGEAKPLFVIEPEPEIYIGAVEAGSGYEKEFTVHLKKDEIRLGDAKVEASFPVDVKIISLTDKELKVSIKATGIQGRNKQVKFAVEIPIAEPKGWPPLKFQFQGRIR